MDDRLITVAIHTYDRALELKTYLENEGVEAFLQNVNLSNPVVASGVRIRIHEGDLPKALRLIENVEIFTAHSQPIISSEKKRIILVPIDFSDMSKKACYLAFRLAQSHKAELVILNAFVDPSMTPTIQLSDNLDYDITESEIRETIAKDAESRMAEWSDELRTKIKNGELPPVKFSREILEGLPEEVINEYAKRESPLLIVMGTRGVEKKERELIGSVTAEVLDTCRTPIFTVPEDLNISSLEELKHVVLFCGLDQEDLLALDSLSRLCKSDNLKITLVNIPSKKQLQDIDAPMNALLGYCKQHYPIYDFTIRRFSLRNVVDEFNELIKEQKVDLIAVPNKKKNVFARLFNPGLAHRLLFHTDTPMMVLPV